MHRKILGICAALVALGAFAIAPSMASAITLQDTEGGLTTKVEVGKKVVALTDPGTIAKFSAGINVECNENILTGSVHKNDGIESQITIEAAWFQSNLADAPNEKTECWAPSTGQTVTVTIPDLTNSGGKLHWCIRSIPNKDEWEVWGNNCTTDPTTGKFTFILDFTGGITCSYERTTPIKGTFTTVKEHQSMTLSHPGAEFKTDTSSSIFCPASGTLSEFKFNVYTDTEGAIGNVHSKRAFVTPVGDEIFANPVA